MTRFAQARFSRGAASSLMAASLCFTLAGCQSSMGPGASLALDMSDPCRDERANFANSKNYFQDQIATGAAVGALTGAVGGALVSVASGNMNVGSILAGAAIGAVAGGVVGGTSAYYNTLAERAHDQDTMAAAMNQDLAREAQEIDRTVATFARLRACRFGQARFVKTQVRSRIVDRPTGLQRIAYHRDHFDEEIRTAREFGLTMARRGRQFQEAANDLRTKAPVRAAQGTSVQAARPVAGRPSARVASVDRAASVSVPEKRSSFDRTVAAAAQNSKAAFDIDSSANLTWRVLSWFEA